VSTLIRSGGAGAPRMGARTDTDDEVDLVAPGDYIALEVGASLMSSRCADEVASVVQKLADPVAGHRVNHLRGECIALDGSRR
jgi:hypothetical protein